MHKRIFSLVIFLTMCHCDCVIAGSASVCSLYLRDGGPMRFAIPLFPARALRLSGNADEWPMALRFVVVIVPACICIALAATWLGYNAASVTLADSLETLPLLKAKVQAERLNSTYTHFRHSLERIAQLPLLNAQEVETQLELFFQDSFPLLGEFGLYNKNGKSFLLLRDGEAFREITGGNTASEDYSLFQQVASLPLIPGKTTLFPVVFNYYPSREGKDRPRKVPVVRMALPLADGSGALVAGIDLDALQKKIGVYSRVNSPLRSPLQEDPLQVSYFFDSDGWILFEMTGTENNGFFPDLARRGYTGDLGRPGYDAAFRPWGVHEDYWRMITEIKENRSGSSPATAEHFSSVQAQNKAFLCYAPVYFAQSDVSPPQLIGGIAFFETSNLPLTAFLRVANVSLFVVVGTIALLGMLAMVMGRRLSRPLNSMAVQLKSMEDGGELQALEATPICMEHQKLLATTNSLISRAMAAQTGLERIQREVLHARARSPVDLNQLVSSPPENSEFDLVGSSTLINEVREQVRKAARAGTDVLIWGETGTGKELVAAAIHKASPRVGGPYISINCGALDESLLMDTLFGHVKGAFTEAKADRKGAFLSADGGTLLLDEIANASPKVQQALLRALSVRRIRPLGADVEVSFNTRVVAATNVDLRECVRAGAFREDLYYRLAIISIETPPLRHRKEDIPQLAAFCIREAAETMGQPEVRLSRGALELMAAHDWPGNVRELKNCLTRAMAFVEGDLILPQHIVLEQDAFRAYGRPVSAQVLASRFKAEDFREPAAVQPARRWEPSGREGSGSLAETQATSEFDNKPGGGPQHSPLGTGHAAEYLWPAPPREAFTPARPEKDFRQDIDARSGGEGDAAPSAPAGGAAGNTAERGGLGEDGRLPPYAPGDIVSSLASLAGRAGGADAPLRSGVPGDMAQDGIARNVSGLGEFSSPSGFFSAPSTGPLPADNGGQGQRFDPASPFGTPPLMRSGPPDAAPSWFPGGQRWPAADSAPPFFSSPARSSQHAGQSGGHTASYIPSYANNRAHDPTEPVSGETRRQQPPLPINLNERQLRGLEFLHANGTITRAQYEGIAGQDLSSRTAQNDLKELVELGILERVGAGPGVRYRARRHMGDS